MVRKQFLTSKVSYINTERHYTYFTVFAREQYISNTFRTEHSSTSADKVHGTAKNAQVRTPPRQARAVSMQ